VGDAQVAYDNVPFGRLDSRCTLKVGVALEDALNQYIRAFNSWNKCFQAYACEVEGAVLAGIRRHWSEATERLDYASKRLGTVRAYHEGADFPGG